MGFSIQIVLDKYTMRTKLKKSFISIEQSNTAAFQECSDMLSTSLTTKTGKPCVIPGDKGAAVVDKQSDIVLGFAVAILEHVTFCLHLKYALNSLSEMYNFIIGMFRT